MVGGDSDVCDFSLNNSICLGNSSDKSYCISPRVAFMGTFVVHPEAIIQGRLL